MATLAVYLCLYFRQPCIPTVSEPGDHVDNDCDGEVDEDGSCDGDGNGESMGRIVRRGEQ
jgi:hypothetical protein